MLKQRREPRSRFYCFTTGLWKRSSTVSARRGSIKTRAAKTSAKNERLTLWGFGSMNGACPSISRGSWTVALRIRDYGDNGYIAEVFSQRCEKCGQLGTFALHAQSYVERVANRLQIWAGVPVNHPRRGVRKDHRTRVISVRVTG